MEIRGPIRRTKKTVDPTPAGHLPLSSLSRMEQLARVRMRTTPDPAFSKSVCPTHSACFRGHLSFQLASDFIPLERKSHSRAARSNSYE